MLELDSKLLEKVWVPDLFVVNEKRANFHDVTVPNKMMHLHKDGSIEYKARYCFFAIYNTSYSTYSQFNRTCLKGGVSQYRSYRIENKQNLNIQIQMNKSTVYKSIV